MVFSRVMLGFDSGDAPSCFAPIICASVRLLFGLWSFSLLDSLWNEYRTSSAINRLAQEDPPTAEELDNLSDEQVSDLLRTRRLKNQVR
jgi:hypothetical protein